MKAILLSLVLFVSACGIDFTPRPTEVFSVEGRVDSLRLSHRKQVDGELFRPNRLIMTLFFEDGRMMSFDGVSPQPVLIDETITVYYHEVRYFDGALCRACRVVDSVKVSID